MGREQTHIYKGKLYHTPQDPHVGAKVYNAQRGVGTVVAISGRVPLGEYMVEFDDRVVGQWSDTVNIDDIEEYYSLLCRINVIWGQEIDRIRSNK